MGLYRWFVDVARKKERRERREDRTKKKEEQKMQAESRDENTNEEREREREKGGQLRIRTNGDVERREERRREEKRREEKRGERRRERRLLLLFLRSFVHSLFFIFVRPPQRKLNLVSTDNELQKQKKKKKVGSTRQNEAIQPL
jgi:hypothetical protein